LLGIDLVKIERIEKNVKERRERFLKKIFTPSEINSIGSIASIAGKWAAKEAVAKALGSGIKPSKNLSFQDIEIKKTDAGAPFALLSKKATKKFGISKIHLSITHDGEYAVAAAVIYPPPTN